MRISLKTLTVPNLVQFTTITITYSKKKVKMLAQSVHHNFCAPVPS